jgi:phosphopantetheinyl transferase
MSSSDAEIQRVYHEDQRHPYYSLQGGKPQLTNREQKAKFNWGHFANALAIALEHPVNTSSSHRVA